MIHVNICRSAKVNNVSLGAEMLWVRILTLVDDNGNYDRDPLLVFANGCKSKKGVKLEDVGIWMEELIESGLLRTYQSGDETFIHFTDFDQYQNLRADRGVVVTWPVHPVEMGDGYSESGKGELVRRQMTTTSQPVYNHVPQPRDNHLPAERPQEVEVKDKEKVEVEADDDHDLELRSGSAGESKPIDWRGFQRAFKDASGVKPNERFHGRLYEELCQRFSEDSIRDVIDDFVEKHGTKARTRKNAWSVKNFLEEAEDLIDSKREVAKDEAMPPDMAKIPGFRTPAVQM